MNAKMGTISDFSGKRIFRMSERKELVVSDAKRWSQEGGIDKFDVSRSTGRVKYVTE